MSILIAPSHAARRRGSKPWLGKVAAGVWLSPPARRRGSKPRERHGERGRAGRLLRGGVDRNIFGAMGGAFVGCRHLRGGVDGNTAVLSFRFSGSCRHLLGGGDRTRHHNI